MSAIRNALEKLNGSLQNLEKSVSTFERNAHLPKGAQHDMFSNPEKPKREPSNENSTEGLNVSLMAQRLDIAIEKVEEILSEAKTA